MNDCPKCGGDGIVYIGTGEYVSCVECEERLWKEAAAAERARIVSAIEARCEQLSRGDKSDREGAEWGRAILEDALAALDAGEHEGSGR